MKESSQKTSLVPTNNVSGVVKEETSSVVIFALLHFVRLVYAVT